MDDKLPNAASVVDNTGEVGAMESRAEKVRLIKELEPVRVTPTEPIGVRAAEHVARSFGEMENQTDKRIALFPMATVGKIVGHGGFKISTIIGEIVNLYKTSIPAWSEPEVSKAGHKPHNNIEAYHYYVNKFFDESGESFIRFTVQEMKTGRKVRRRTPGENFIHSTTISDVTVYNITQTAMSHKVSGKNTPVLRTSPPFVDKKLQDFFDSVKEKKD